MHQHQRLRWIAHLWKNCTRNYHHALLPYLCALVPADGVIIDVGANAGQFTRVFSRAVPQGQVLAFEPGSYAHSILVPHVRLRGLANVKLFRAAVGETDGTVAFYTPAKATGLLGYGLSHVAAAGEDTSRGVREEVAMVCLDSVVRREALARLDFIKVDVEGYEARVLAGGLAAIARFRPVVMLEAAPTHLARAGSSFETLLRQITELGYRVFTLHHDGRMGSPVEFVDRAEEGDLFCIPEEDVHRNRLLAGFTHGVTPEAN